jgi:hypothetical protein
MAHARLRSGIGILVGLAVPLIASPAHAVNGLVSLDVSTTLRVKGCGKVTGAASLPLALTDAGTWSAAVDADEVSGAYVAGGKGGRTLTLSYDPGSFAIVQAALRDQAGTLCGAPADSAVLTLKRARVKLNKAGTSASLLVKMALSGDGNPLKKGKYKVRGSGPLGPLPTTTTTSTAPTTSSTIAATSSTTSTATSSSTSTSVVSSTTSTTILGGSTTSTTPIATTSSSTSTSTSSSTTTSIAPASTTSTTASGSSTTSTTNPGASTTSTTIPGSSTTSTTIIATTTTVPTTSTTSTTVIPPTGYGDCVNGGSAACTPAETCFSAGFEGNTVGLCTVPCAQAEDCPAPITGNPRVSCGPNAPACFLFCDGGETCPDGMECFAGQLCAFSGPCTPTCDGRTCGDDGCGLTCGDCASGSICVDGQCQAGDSCVGRCNTFDELAGCQCDSICFGAGDCCPDLCNPGVCDGQDICTCVPDCTGRVCGSDGCFGTCGECQTVGDVCSSAGQCTSGASCVGRCDDTYDPAASCECDVGCLVAGDCCTDVCDPGVCESGDVCTCVPDCTGRECGSDGCAGSCGDCFTVGDVCSPAGQCVSGTSCVGRCGFYDENALCQCDAECVTTFGDCCLDLCDAGVCAGVPPCS